MGGKWSFWSFLPLPLLRVYLNYVTVWYQSLNSVISELRYFSVLLELGMVHIAKNEWTVIRVWYHRVRTGPNAILYDAIQYALCTLIPIRPREEIIIKVSSQQRFPTGIYIYQNAFILFCFGLIFVALFFEAFWLSMAKQSWSKQNVKSWKIFFLKKESFCGYFGFLMLCY